MTQLNQASHGVVCSSSMIGRGFVFHFIIISTDFVISVLIFSQHSDFQLAKNREENWKPTNIKQWVKVISKSDKMSLNVDWSASINPQSIQKQTQRAKILYSYIYHIILRLVGISFGWYIMSNYMKHNNTVCIQKFDPEMKAGDKQRNPTIFLNDNRSWFTKKLYLLKQTSFQYEIYIHSQIDSF